jgi:two-component system, sensor histidine kinase and response regulator
VLPMLRHFVTVSSFLQRSSLRMLALSIGSVMIALVLALGGLALERYRSEGLARVGLIGDSVSSAMIFMDKKAAGETLGTLRMIPDFRFASLHTSAGELFEHYFEARNGGLPSGLDTLDDGVSWGPSGATFTRTIVVDRDVIGRITIGVGMKALYREIAAILGVGLFGMLSAMVLAMQIHRAQAKQIVEPLTALASLTHSVSLGKTDLKAPDSRLEELGVLGRGFNHMLEQLRERDQQLSRNLETLEEKVKARTGELELAKDAAEAGSRAKSDFLATMSHEIRTPMNGVLGMTELLRGTRVNVDQLRYIDSLERSGRHLLDIINDILDFSKIESGKLEVESVAFDLRDVIEEAIEHISPAARAKGFDVVADVTVEHDLYIKGDPLRLKQVLVNLLGNAVKFTERGEVVVRLHLKSVQANRFDFAVAVTDTGIGIPERARTRIFESFSQVDGSTTRRFGGTGLGLAICKKLTELMGGQITVSSEEGVGSTFTIELSADRAASVARKPLAAPHVFTGTKVLVVDDHLTNLEILSCMLRGWGMFPVAVQDGHAAIKALRENEGIRLVITDIHMPEFSGLALGRQIRREFAQRNLPVIALSSTTQTLTAQDRREAGFAVSLTKPVRQSDLFNTIREAMGVVENELPAHTQAPATPTAHALSGTVLLAEDNETNQIVALAWLRSVGLTATVANNGVEAVAACARTRFDLILMDCQMPEMDGFAATAQVRAIEARQNRRASTIVALTANALKEDRERCLKAGMNDYLAKPYSGAELQAMLSKWLPRDTSAQNAPLPEPDDTDGEHTPALQNEPAIDRSVLKGIAALVPDDGNSLVERLVITYLNESAIALKALQTAIEHGDADATALAAHGLKSSSFNVGARTLSAMLKEIESSARAGDVAAPRLRSDALADEWHQVQDQLSTIVRQGVA